MKRLMEGARCSEDFPWPDELRKLIASKRVLVNGEIATFETCINNHDVVEIDGKKWKAIYRLHETQLERID